MKQFVPSSFITLSFLVILPIFKCLTNIPTLAFLITASQKNHQLLPVSAKVDPIPRTEIYSPFSNAFDL